MYDYSKLENPYYIDRAHLKDFPDAKRSINYYTIKALALLCVRDDVDPSLIRDNWRKYTLPDNVYYKDSDAKVLKYNEYVGTKLEILIHILENEENKEAFKVSYFRNAIRYLFSESYWIDYVNKVDCAEDFKDKNSLTGALLCLKKDNIGTDGSELDFGLNLDLMLSKIIIQARDTWIIKERIYKEDRELIINAIEKYIRQVLQKNKLFLDNYEIRGN